MYAGDRRPRSETKLVPKNDHRSSPVPRHGSIIVKFAAGHSTVYTLFRASAHWNPQSLAIECGGRQWSYGVVLDTVDRLATGLRSLGFEIGDRVAVLSENRVEYTLLQLAAARLGVIVACLNWRLAEEELEHCIGLVEPRLIFVSARFEDMLTRVRHGAGTPLPIADCLGALADHAPDATSPAQDPELGFLLLNTSGTTGLPKAALISHRAEIARMCTLRMDLKIEPGDAYLAWSPMFHMGGSEHTLASLMFGASVIITDGLDIDAMVDAISRFRLGWLLLVPASVEPLLQRLKAAQPRVKGVRVVGCMADLVPAKVISEITRALNAPFLNSFGSTETGLPPATAHLIPVGEVPQDLAKRKSSLCEFRLVDGDGNDVADGEIGEGIVRGPTLFSGYWNAPNTNAEDFRDGWFHMGDLFRRTASGGFEFIGRSKYIIKSGGENIYPAEVERVLLGDSRIADAAVVRKPDSQWGEIVVAFIARNDDSLDATAIEQICRARIAGYKRPREVYFIPMDEMPRSATGKIVREVLERRLAESDAPGA